MKKILLIAFFLFLTSSISLFAQNEEEIEIDEVISSETDSTLIQVDTVLVQLPVYEKWEKASINGKLKMKGLPLSPSLRFYLQKDSLLDISVRAPLMGEVVRITFSTDSVIGVNKMNHTYTKQYIADFMRFYPGGISEIQSLLLGRVVFPQSGELSMDFAEKLNIEPTEEGFSIVPDDTVKLSGIEYGYLVDYQFHPLVFMVIPENNKDAFASISYSYDKDGYDMLMQMADSSRSMNLTLELNNPKFEGEPFKPIDVKKYTQLSLGEFIRNIGK